MRYAVGPFPNPDSGERLWCCYAWPLRIGRTGQRAFFVNEDQIIYAYDNRDVFRYSGIHSHFFAQTPSPDAIFQVANDMGSPVCNVAAPDGPVLGQDGEYWLPVFDQEDEHWVPVQ